ncbi:MAG: hypothetical protein Q9169_005122 [Polycauliona sp. 2 TL-2023]
MSSSLPTPDPDETIQRILFLSPNIHIYTVPPLTTTKGYTTTGWSPLISPTASDPTPAPITTRLRVLETSSSTSSSSSSSAASSEQQQSNDNNNNNNNNNNGIRTTILLEDPTSGDLFAAAPYTSPSSVEAVLDSARFFAVRVEGEGGRKAMLGIGFEDRSEAIDFGICLQEVRKLMGFEGGDKERRNPAGGTASRTGRRAGGMGAKALSEKEMGMKKGDWSLKEGEMIKLEIGGMGVKRKEEQVGGGTGQGGESALFSIKPPSHGQNGGSMPFLPPPPSTQELKAERRRSRGPAVPEEGSAAELGFDDGEFGEFQ